MNCGHGDAQRLLQIHPVWILKPCLFSCTGRNIVRILEFADGQSSLVPILVLIMVDWMVQNSLQVHCPRFEPIIYAHIQIP